MRVLVLGGSGFVGRAVVRILEKSKGFTPVIASRRPVPTATTECVSVDVGNESALAAVLRGMDAVVNCTTGSGATIAHGAERLCKALQASGCSRLVHLSSQSVYGSREGLLTERTEVLDDLGWYGRAKILAEGHVQRWSQHGGQAWVLRPGCVSGEGSPLWASRLQEWLWTDRLGDLGSNGDGWSNLVHVRDVAQAVARCLALADTSIGVGEPAVFNLAAPDSPRWNRYFLDLALALGATPVERVGALQLALDARAVGVPLKLFEHALRRLDIRWMDVPPAIPPSLVKVWRQQIQLSSLKATEELRMQWVPYARLLKDSSIEEDE